MKGGYRDGPMTSHVPAIRRIQKVLFITRRWHAWGIEAQRKYARELARACRDVADQCDDFINKTEPF